MSEKEILAEALKLDLPARKDLAWRLLMTLTPDEEGGAVRTLADTIARQGRRSAEVARPYDAWPPGFFEAIGITDPTFTRPEQGQLPPSPVLDPTA